MKNLIVGIALGVIASASLTLSVVAALAADFTYTNPVTKSFTDGDLQKVCVFYPSEKITIRHTDDTGSQVGTLTLNRGTAPVNVECAGQGLAYLNNTADCGAITEVQYDGLVDVVKTKALAGLNLAKVSQ